MQLINTSSRIDEFGSWPTDSASPLEEVHWYAAYTSANHEKKVAEELQRRSVESFLPLYKSVRRWKDRFVTLEVPLFRGYVFVRFALHERARMIQIPGLVRFVGFNGRASQVPEIDITRLRRVLCQGVRTEPHPYLIAGCRVRVKTGALAGLEGIILRRKKNSRFVITIESIQRAISLEIDGLELEPLAGGVANTETISSHD